LQEQVKIQSPLNRKMEWLEQERAKNQKGSKLVGWRRVQRLEPPQGPLVSLALLSSPLRMASALPSP
jgi:hypothetical protein